MSSNQDTTAGIATLAVLAFLVGWTIVCVLFGKALGSRDATSAMQLEAKEAGIAEYYLDINNNRRFRWLKELTEKQE